MENSYWLFFIIFFCLSLGTFLGVQLVKFFSSEVLEKLEISFEEQLDESKQFYKSTQKKVLESIDEKTKSISTINMELEKCENRLIDLDLQLEILNRSCSERFKLESEIIKLKKIIQRLEKKNGIL